MSGGREEGVRGHLGALEVGYTQPYPRYNPTPECPYTPQYHPTSIPYWYWSGSMYTGSYPEMCYDR